MKNTLVFGLGISLLASIFTVYRRETIVEHQVVLKGRINRRKEHRMTKTRFAQIGAVLLIAGLSVQNSC
jgi:hypothetical protein